MGRNSDKVGSQDLNARATQEGFSVLLSRNAPDGQQVSQQAIQKLAAAGILPPGGTLLEWLIAYSRHMNDVAAKWISADGAIDRVKEAALLDRTKREKLQLEIAEKNGQLLPVEMMVQGISLTFGAVKAALLGIPTKYRQRCPHIAFSDHRDFNVLTSRSLS